MKITAKVTANLKLFMLRKDNRWKESRVDGSEGGDDDKVHLLTSAIMEEDIEQTI